MREQSEKRKSDQPPANLEEALVSARRHARAALGEAALAARALLDALALATSGATSETSRTLSWVAAALDDAARSLGHDAPHTSSLLGAVVEALDAEIARWEARAGVDRDARAVLRAYLGLREILWELGLRAPQNHSPRESVGQRKPSVPDASRSAPRQRSAARGVERVRIDG